MNISFIYGALIGSLYASFIVGFGPYIIKWIKRKRK
jgi:hypothetical protein